MIKGPFSTQPEFVPLFGGKTSPIKWQILFDMTPLAETAGLRKLFQAIWINCA
jgi:hypothetical protein